MIEELAKNFVKMFNEKKKKELEEIIIEYGSKYKEELSRRRDDEYYRNYEWDNRRNHPESKSI